MFHIRNIPRRFCTIMECTNAVSAIHGIKAAFSTGSQNQNPPHPRMVYAHQDPSSSPAASSAQMPTPHARPASIHSSPPRPPISPPSANAIGMLIPASPAISAGGCKNIPKCVSSGLMPCPSAAGNGSRWNGFAINAITARKNTSMNISMATVHASVGRVAAGASRIATADNAASAKAMYSSDPSLPA